MRLDKYLKASGLIKRRVIANEACSLGLVKINGTAARASKEVSAGDVIDISLAKRELSIRILKPIEGNSIKKSARSEYIEILKDVQKKVLDDFWQQNTDD